MGKANKFHHRPTTKQVNKRFKSKHASKGSVRDIAKGKVNKTKAGGMASKEMTKKDRKNHLKLIRENKNESLNKLNNVFNGKEGATKMVAVVPLCTDINSLNIIQRLFYACKQDLPANFTSSITLNSDILKHKIQFLILNRDLYSILDACKVADYVIFVLSGTTEVDPFGELCISSIQAQGIPNSFNLVDHLTKVPIKSQPDVKKSLSSFINYFFPESDKIFSVENEIECLNILRSIATQTPKIISFRENHPYMFADHVDYCLDQNNPEVGTLAVTGFVRGNNWDVNRLVHIQDLGNFQIKGLESAINPYLGEHTISAQQSNKIQIVPNPELQDSLISHNEVDSMEGEQTWPTEEELREADERINLMGLNKEDNKPRTKRVIKGTSSYQAAWIVDSEGEESDLSNDDMERDEISHDDEDEEEYEDIIDDEDNNDTKIEEIISKDEDMEHYKEYMKQKEIEFKGNKEFPDEVDTPLNINARTRFQRYRGMLSIRTSPWDPYENLPVDYSKIFMIKDYNQTKTKVIQNANQDIEQNPCAAKMGSYVTIYISNVPKSISDIYNKNNPFILFGLLQHENKVTLLNYNVIRTTEFNEPIKSKEPLVIQTGFQRYVIEPIFSQNAKKSKPLNNVYKFERFLPKGDSYNLSFYGPIQFNHDSCLLFKKDINQNINLVATGTFKDSDCNRIIAKRIILTGHPFKVNRKSAVVRYMFFNSDDIAWFKPIQLTTKFGKVGHIKDSIGTHGYMKCIFNSPIKQHDTICMYLYKRVFPKWKTTLFNRFVN